MNLNNTHKDLCRMCGQCCFIAQEVELTGLKFIPTSHVCENLLEEDRIVLGMMVCQNFDMKTRQCNDYENRPDQCKKYYCNGNPHPQKVIFEGKPAE